MRVSGSHTTRLSAQLATLLGAYAPDFFQQCDLIPAFAPTDIDTDADGDWVDTTGYAGCAVLLFKAAGTAGDDPSIRLQQATSAAGAGAKALVFDNLRHKIATSLATIGTWTTPTITPTADLDLFTPTDFVSDNKQAMFVVDVKPADLDSQNNFKYLQLSVEGDDMSNSQYACGLYILYGRTPSVEPPNQLD